MCKRSSQPFGLGCRISGRWPEKQNHPKSGSYFWPVPKLVWTAPLVLKACVINLLCFHSKIYPEDVIHNELRGPCPQKSTSERDLGFRRMFKYHHRLWGARPLLALRISFGSSDSSLILVRRCSCIRSKNMWGLPKRIRKRYNSVQNWIAKTVDGRCATWPNE